MITDEINTFTNTTPAINREFVTKIELRQLPVTVTHTQTQHSICQSCLLQHKVEALNSKKRENEQIRVTVSFKN